MKSFWVFNPVYHPEQVRGHQLERLRLAILMRPRKSRPYARWNGKRLEVGTLSEHRTLGGRHINLIARIKRRLRPLRREDIAAIVKQLTPVPGDACPACHGSGNDHMESFTPCSWCDGEGRVLE